LGLAQVEGLCQGLGFPPYLFLAGLTSIGGRNSASRHRFSATTAEPAWHRRARRDRARARAITTLASARGLLAQHHGSGQTQVEDMRSHDEKRPAWRCRTCKVQGQPFVNFGHRLSCHRCSVKKGQCFLETVQPAAPAVRTTAMRQLQQQRGHDKVERLKNENHKLQQQLREAKSARLLKDKNGGKDTDDEDKDEGMEVDTVVFEFTLEQLRAQRQLFRAQGTDDGHPVLAPIVRQIAIQEKAELSERPDSVRIAAANRRIKNAKKKQDDSQLKAEKLQKDVADLQERLHQAREAAEKAEQDVREAESQKETLLKDLQTETSVPHAAEATVDVATRLVQERANLPGEFLRRFWCGQELLGEHAAESLQGFGRTQAACDAAPARACTQASHTGSGCQRQGRQGGQEGRQGRQGRGGA